jgi:tetratricopeptide (TPR) repeat protein
MRLLSRRVMCGGGVAFILLLSGCGRNGTGMLYRAERDLWQAVRVERGLRVGPETPPTPAETDRVIAAYRLVLGRNPQLSEKAGDTASVHGIGRVRAQALSGLVRMHRLRDEHDEVRQRLDEARKAFPWDLNLTVRFDQELVEELRSQGKLEEASLLYQEMASTLPARRPDGRPVVQVQDAPIRAADILGEMGRQDEALAELDRAEVYYRTVIQENPNDAAASLAWLQLGTVAARRGEFKEANDALEKARRSPGASGMEPRILLVQGTLQQEALKNPEAAATVFLDLIERFPDDPVVPEAMIRRAAAFSDLGRPDDALVVLQDLKDKHSRDRANAAKGALLAARILVRAQRWPEALSHYRALMADFPTSAEAIGAPFEIANHYQQIGEKDAVTNTLERALEDFAGLHDSYPGSPAAWMADESTARALLRLGRYEEAIGKLVSMPDQYPRDPRNPLLLLQAAGIAVDRLKDKTRAAEILDQIVARYPGSSVADKARQEAARLRGE